MSRSRPRAGCGLSGLALAVTLIASAALPTATAAARSRTRSARLEGFFLLSGRVTVAANVSGEHVGERVRRIWAFKPLCAAGPCRRIELVRIRPGGRDRVILHRAAPGSYVGRGRFYAPLGCATRIYRKGEAVPFRVTVRIAAAKLVGATAIASRLRAFYTNPSRRNLTPCVSAPGHDAAVYHGHLL
jgi:hypothetical protein